MNVVPLLPVPLIIIVAVVLLVLSPRTKLGFIKRILMIILLVSISLRIMVPSDEVTIVKNDIDVLFVIDNTISMLAEDYSGNTRRIDAVKNDVRTIMDEFEGARFAVVSFSNDPYYMVPYTTDRDVVTNAVDSLNGLTEYSGEGTSFRNAYDGMETMLKFNLEKNEDEDSPVDAVNGSFRIQVVFLITDGEMTVGRNMPDFSEISDMIDDGAVLGYGTEEGGQMRVYSYASYYGDETAHVLRTEENGRNTVALSKIDEENLEKMADELGVDYTHMTGPVQAKRVSEDIFDRLDDGEISREKAPLKGQSETYWISAIALAALMLVELYDLRRKLRATE